MFYTYLWLREDGTPYYVGKGSVNRAYIQYGHRVKMPPRECVIVQDFEEESDALFAEMFLIASYGRIDIHTGCLANLTDGGQNPPSKLGFKHSDKTRKQMSKARTGMSGNMLGKHQTEKQKEAMRRVHTGKRVSEETRNKMSKAQMGHTVSEEARHNMSLARIGKKYNYPKTRKSPSEETRAKLRDAQQSRRKREKHGNFI
jgi:hypothetical protein